MSGTARPEKAPGRAVPFSGRLRILGLPVDIVDAAQALRRCEAFLAEDRPRQVITANPLMILAAEKDSALRAAFEAADLVVPDGSGLALAAGLQGRRLSRVPGIDLLESLCGGKRRIYLLGAAPGVAADAGRTLADRHPGLEVVGIHHGYFTEDSSEEAGVFRELSDLRPDILFVGLSTPFQDAWIHKNLAKLGSRIVMGVGGSFDVLSGRLRRAPVWMRFLGLEWFFRTLQEPARFFRLMGLPKFLFKVIKARQG